MDNLEPLVSIDLALNDFAAEPSTGSTGTRSTTIGDVLVASTPLHWDEVVALLQEIIELVTSMRRDDIPPFEDVVINREGSLTIRGTGRGERGPVAAGRALHALLATAEVPVALRLFVTQANAPETHESLDAFADGLAYFGKADRAELIRAVYARYKPPGSATAPSSSEAATPQPRPAAAPRKSLPLVTARALRSGLIAATAVVAVVSVAAIAWLSLARGKQAATISAGTVAGTTTAGALSAPAATKTKKIATPHPATSELRAVQSSAPPVQRPQPSGDLAADVTTAAPAQIGSVAEAFVRLTPSPALVTPTRETALAPVVYSRDDIDVQPPVMLHPQLPPPFLVGSPSEALVNRMELVVGPDGSVERVRLTNAPRRMVDMMLLSGAKLWRFTPAFKDGVPVRYRTTVSWTVFP